MGLNIGSMVTGGLLDLYGQKRQADHQEKENRIEREMAREFAQHGVRWKVEDAKAAGLHPLYAVGASGATYSPSISTGGGVGEAISRMGQNISRGVYASATKEEREKHDLELAVLRSTVGENDARANYYNSEAARNAQTANASKPIPMPDQIKPKPDEQVSHRSSDASQGAGTHPAFREYTISKYGLKMDLPYSEEGPGESLENIPWYMWPVVIQHNRAKYGSDWGQRFIQEYMYDSPPVYRSNSERPSERFKRSGFAPGPFPN